MNLLKKIKLSVLTASLLLGSSVFASTPSDGEYTFANASSNNDGTVTTEDSFFIIDRLDGSGNNLNVAADSYGAYIASAGYDTVSSEITSYLEVKVATTGSFYLTSAEIGEYESGNSSTSNNFKNVYLVGYANSSSVCQTIPISSINSYDTAYTIDYSPCDGILIDKFRTYFTSNDSNARLRDFNLVKFSLTGASTTSIPSSDSDGDLVAGDGVDESSTINIPTTATASGSAVDILDFKITDGGYSDSADLTVTALDIHVSGTDNSKLTYLLTNASAGTNQGSDLSSAITGTYSGGTVSFDLSGNNIVIANGDTNGETYVIKAFFNDPTLITDNTVITASIDGDTDITSTTTTIGSSTAVSNSGNAKMGVTATKLKFIIMPNR